MLTENKDLKTDDELSFDGFKVVTVDCGVDAMGWEIKRRFLPQQLTAFPKDKIIVVPYEEWRVIDGKVYNEFYRVKTYRVCDNHDLNDLKFTLWMKTILSIIGQPIADTLAQLPENVPDGALVNGTPADFKPE